MDSLQETLIIVPCYNESRRLRLPGFEALLEEPSVRLLFVDDGSRDDTAALLRSYCSGHPGRAELLSLERNGGKGEAVRRGFLHGLGQGAAILGFLDADLATSAAEMRRLVQELARRPETEALFGARIQLLGRNISRKPHRHYLGRIFATVASLLLRIRVYDTQCGAKLFRNSAALRAALDAPFGSRWIFDVELIGRLLLGGPGIPPLPVGAFREEPLAGWQDVRGSKLGPLSMLAAVLQLLKVGWRLQRRAARLRRDPRPEAGE